MKRNLFAQIRPSRTDFWVLIYAGIILFPFPTRQNVHFLVNVSYSF